jgi:hypothetical protein
VKKQDDTRTLLVRDERGLFRVTIPSGAKVTFAPISPADRGGYADGKSYALRIYESQSQQLAAFVGVRWFRDLSLKVERQFTTETGSEEWRIDEDSSEVTRKSKKERAWRADADR